jgi:hypothetical protein
MAYIPGWQFSESNDVRSSTILLPLTFQETILTMTSNGSTNSALLSDSWRETQSWLALDLVVGDEEPDDDREDACSRRCCPGTVDSVITGSF